MCLQNTEIPCAVAQTHAGQASRPFPADDKTMTVLGLVLTQGVQLF